MNRIANFAWQRTLLGAAALLALAAPVAHAQPARPMLAMMDDMMGGGGAMGGNGMGGMQDNDNRRMGGMGGMGGNTMSAPSPGAMSPPPMRPRMSQPGNVDMMGSARRGASGMQAMPSLSQLPGFPGGSHLYHVGATGFFLDHPQHITLATEQQAMLNKVREKWMLESRGFERRLDEAEQALWTLTAAESPDIAKIEQQVRAIERLRGDQRIAFVRAVGEAARALTPDQQAVLLGNKPPPAKGANNATR